jgi:hypothetical protein
MFPNNDLFIYDTVVVNVDHFSLLRLLHSNKTFGRGVQKYYSEFLERSNTAPGKPSRDSSVIKLAFYKSIKSSYCEQICWQILDFLISCSLDVFICAL